MSPFVIRKRPTVVFDKIAAGDIIDGGRVLELQ